MGVDVRLHLSFPLLLLVAAVYGQAVVHNSLRGVGVWAALFFAVIVRETARAIAAAYLGLRLRAIYLLPMGGVMAFGPDPAGTPGEDSLRPLTLSAPLANLSAGLLLLGVSYAWAPGVQLLSQPWISAAHVLRSFVWMQFVIGALNLLPAAALPTRQMLRGSHTSSSSSSAGTPSRRPVNAAFSLLAGLSVALLLGGLVTSNIWLIAGGGVAMLLSQLQAQQPALDPASSDTMRVEDVMLTDFTLLSSSETLRGALERTVHSLQNVFPVVRGSKLVGSVSRQTLTSQLQTEGDGYLQGSMTRDLHTAGPQEPLVATLRRAAAHGASDFIPVVDGARLVGILTSESLTRAVQQVKLLERRADPQDPRP